MENKKIRRLLTIKEAAAALSVSYWFIQQLVNEAETNKKSRWKFGRELIDLSPVAAKRRTIRINPMAISSALVDLQPSVGSGQEPLEQHG